jgi:hypothetical protein
MFKRIGALIVLAAVVFACGGSPTTQTPGAGATDTPGAAATDTPAPGQTTPPNAGDLKTKAQALLPSDATVLSEITVGGAYQVSATSRTSITDLEAFWEQKIKDLGMTQTGKFTAEGVLTIAITNPDGGIVAGTDTSTGDTTITISLGTSS